MGIEKEVYEELNKQDWEVLIKQLTIYAAYQFKFWGLISDKGVKGYSPGEVVFEAIEKVYSGEWKWEPAKSNLSVYLKYHVIRGLIANLATSEEVEKSDTSELEHHTIANKYSTDSVEMQEYNSKLVIEFIKSKIGNDQDVLLIFEGYCKGLKRRDICEITGMNPSRFTNAYKRFQRIIKQLDRDSILNSIL